MKLRFPIYGLVFVLLFWVVAPRQIQNALAAPGLGSEFAISQKADRQMRTLDATWHAGTGQFLVVWSEHPGHSTGDGHSEDDEIRGKLVNLDSSMSADFLISEGGDSKDFPQVAHVLDTLKPEEQISVVVWMDARDGGEDIWGQFIDPTGSAKQGRNFKISAGGEDYFPAIVYGQESSGKGVFLVVWEREVGTNDTEIFGQLIRGAGGPGLMGSNFQISTSASGRASAPEVAYNPVNDRFLVVWTDDAFFPADNESDIQGQFVDINGGLAGVNFQVSSQTGAEGGAQVLFHPKQGEYLVVWDHASDLMSNYDVYAQRLSASGGLMGGVINVAATADYEGAGQPAIDRDSGSYIIPLTMGSGVTDRSRVEMVKLNAVGVPVGVREQIATDTVENKGPTVAVYGSTPVGPGAGVSALSEVLIAWRDARSAVDPERLLSQDIFGRMAEVEADSDGDGLLDSWETNQYVDANDNGMLDAGDFNFNTLPGADRPDPNHKDLYIEVDWMQVDADGDGIFCDSISQGCDPNQAGDHSHGPLTVTGSLPTGTSLDPIIASFANAPVPNPDGTTGINLHIDVGQMGGGGPTPDVTNLDFFASGAANFESYKTANFSADRERVFHYVVMKHEGSGRAEIWGNDFWVGAQYNTQVLQPLDVMHEFGHNLGLRHGGFENLPNCKPNYLSIMSYTFCTTGIPPNFRLDYSSQVLLQLDESNLNEATPLGDGIDHTGDAIDQTVFSVGSITVGPNTSTAANAGIDWDNDGTANESGANVGNNNLNEVGGCFLSASNEIHNGYDDWDNIRYNFLSSPNFDDNVHAISDPIDAVSVIDFWRDHYEEPDLSLFKTGTLQGVPNDDVSYEIAVLNSGPGPARNIVIEDNWPAGLTFVEANPSPLINILNPDGSRTLTWRFDTLAANESLTLTLRGIIYFPPVADEVTQSVVVHGQNVLGEPTASLEDSVTTDVQFPEMRMSKSATVSVAAGDAITYRIVFENVSDGSASDVVITDILPRAVYYSQALDLGAGPRPDMVTSNPDGTTTLRWNIDVVSPNPGVIMIEYTARPSLLLFAGDAIVNNAMLAYTDTNRNEYPQMIASAQSKIISIKPSQDLRSLGFWRNHKELWTAEIMAGIQATDDRYDGTGNILPDGQLSAVEVREMFKPGGNQPKMLKMQLLATYFNLADRRINANTLITSKTMRKLGITNVHDAVIFCMDTLALPVNRDTRERYSNATQVLNEINNNLLESLRTDMDTPKALPKARYYRVH